MGFLAPDGQLFLVDRVKDVVIVSGFNVYPTEVEAVIADVPGIAHVAVIGVPDERYGEELCAWVVLREGAAPMTADTLREFATGKLAHYKIPRYVLVVDEFPMTVTGKVRKVEMRERSMDLI